MQEAKKAQFDYINFVYGVGAAVILIAAMFKFLGWEYANEIFIIGLSTEAMVFLVSAFQWHANDNSYKWEKVFPGLASNDQDDISKIDFTESIKGYSNYTESIVNSVQRLDEIMKNMAETSEKLHASSQAITERMDRLEKNSSQYENDFDQMKSKLGLINQFYDELSKVVVEKDKK